MNLVIVELEMADRNTYVAWYTFAGLHFKITAKSEKEMIKKLNSNIGRNAWQVVVPRGGSYHP